MIPQSIKNALYTSAVVALVIAGIVVFLRRSGDFPIPTGNTTLADTQTSSKTTHDDSLLPTSPTSIMTSTSRSSRPISVTDGVQHSIPLAEILSGGPPKDGIPSIDSPKFTSTKNADGFLENDAPGLGLTVDNESRFYPYQILVWHEIVNDTIAGTPVLVTYCPLCATGVVFDRRVDGKEREFGVSGRLWQSNLLMYDRTGNAETESLWSQVLGEAVLGPQTGARLAVVESDITRYGDWKKAHPDTVVLSKDTGSLRTYGLDPYGDYYTNEDVSFGATFTDTRLHPKTLVLGVEINGVFKAYPKDIFSEGIITDTVGGATITITTDANGTVRITDGDAPVRTIAGFWFSWIAVHPKTELYKK